MAGKFTVSLAEIIKEFNLETIYMPKDPGEILIDENDVTRPGLQLMGFYEYFNPERMQIIGKWSSPICPPSMRKPVPSVWIC